MVSISTTAHLPDDKVNEAIADLRRLNDPSNLITYNDGWFARSLAKKWQMDLHTLEALVKEARKQRAVLLYMPNEMPASFANELIEEGTKRMMYELEGYLLSKNVSIESVEWFGEQISEHIKDLHLRGKPTY